MDDAKCYTRIPSSDVEPPECRRKPSTAARCHLAVQCVAFALAALGLLSTGFALGASFVHSAKHSFLEPMGTLHYHMHYNGSFPQRSSEHSDASWDSLFPEKMGFVKHPELAPNVAGIAVFHELHCLNILRQAFFASVDGQLEEFAAEIHDANHRTSGHHIRHCFEYLRQSLICLADANLEEMNYTTRGVSGWQTERTCRDFEGLRTWADEWGIAREDALRDRNRELDFVHQ